MSSPHFVRAPRRTRTILLFLALLFGALILQSTSAAPAQADEVGTEYDFYFAGNVKYESKPLEDVTISVEGNGYNAEVETDAEGKWKIGVPEKGTYTVTLDEETLPKGVIVAEGSASVESEIALTNSKIVNYFLGEGVRVTTSFFDQLVERTVNGLNFGLLLALAAVGASLVFGTTGLSNFAHGEMVTFGAVMALLFVNLEVPLWAALPVAVVMSGVFGYVLDTGLWRPLRRRGIGIVQVMIVSIGLSLLIRYLFLYFIGGGTYQLPGAGEAGIKLFGSVTLSITDMISMATSAVVLLGVAWWLVKTRTGKATRAISDNPSLAAASGIDVDRVVRIVWILAGALAGLAGILWAYFRPGIKWDMGTQILLLVFGAIVLGGLGTAFGALLGSIIVGLLVELSTLWIPSDIKYVGALVVLIAVLLVKPQGLLGRKERIG
ncbi:MAG: branched-chain amino acid transporter permease [Mycetocola sp.]|nr:branched-chain amino acid transporter permease [Mycetocola sp.]MCU1560819.1 branched-chain amino acid transporter permease [Mycetocola sp.]